MACKGDPIECGWEARVGEDEEVLRQWRGFGESIVTLDNLYGGNDAVIHDLALRALRLLGGEVTDG